MTVVGPPDLGAGTGSLLRATANISALNAVSRVTGFGRVLAIGAALGTTFAGNAYQSANLVSNLLFELLAAGLLTAPLIPLFVGLVDRGQRAEAERVAGVILGLALAGLGVVVVVALVAAPAIMGLLTVAVDDPDVRRLQVELGTFLLWFFLPQVLLYAVLAVASALLNAERRFAAAAAAPIANNLVVIATMVAFIVLRDGGAPPLDLPLDQRLVLALGTTGGVVAMAAVPVIAVRRAGMVLRPRWAPRDPRLRQVWRIGAWGGVLLGSLQVLSGVTLVLANRVEGGVVAYQIAFTFFLLPVALIAHPLFTALYPRLASDAQAGRTAQFGRDVGEALRRLLALSLPAAAILIALGGPGLRAVRAGALDVEGADFVARVLAAYALGLAGYGAFLLLSRAFTALDDARFPALVGLAAAAGGAMLMMALSAGAEGEDRVVALGIAHSLALTAAGAVAFARLRRDLAQDIAMLAPLARSLATAGAAGISAYLVGTALDDGTRAGALAAVTGGGLVAGATVAMGEWALGGPEARAAARRVRARLGRSGGQS